MTVSQKTLIAFFLFTASFVHAQKLKKEDRQLLSNLQKHVQYLSSDELQGRRTGTNGEKMAADYISTEFRKIGLIPKGTNEYFQSFEINEGKQINPATSLVINNQTLLLNTDYFPLVSSPNVKLEASPSIALQEPGMPWFFDLNDLITENEGNPHLDMTEAIVKSAKEVKKRGATAVFLYNTSRKEDGIHFNAKDRSETLPIPVIYIQQGAAKKFLNDASASLDIKLTTDLSDKTRMATNVVGFIDNGAPTTVVLGAHFDHLGLGEDGNSREVEKKGLVHNGADDNASGTAALIELARMLKSAKLKHNNYVFVAFSGEELGLYGSKYFIDHSAVDPGTINYMINMDMVGRLSDSSHVVTVGGYGTSPSWGSLYGATGKKKLYAGDLRFRFDSSGTGPSDHTSFYLKNIPVLFYFTGLHPDYHKPTDDFEKINFTGELNLVKHIFSLIEAGNKENQRLAFTKTRESQTTTSARFAVTLGIMPDYTFTGAGVRVDGVSENRPAQKAGIKTGDVIVSIGAFKITSLENYMQALGAFKKGDKTTVVYSRNGQTFSSALEF
jgi:aminopeptidase YwaD